MSSVPQRRPRRRLPGDRGAAGGADAVKVSIGATGVVVGCCALHLGIAAVVAGALWAWPVAVLGAVVAVAAAAAARHVGAAATWSLTPSRGCRSWRSIGGDGLVRPRGHRCRYGRSRGGDQAGAAG